jgi:hypothetical protein
LPQKYREEATRACLLDQRAGENRGPDIADPNVRFAAAAQLLQGANARKYTRIPTAPFSTLGAAPIDPFEVSLNRSPLVLRHLSEVSGVKVAYCLMNFG